MFVVSLFCCCWVYFFGLLSFSLSLFGVISQPLPARFLFTSPVQRKKKKTSLAVFHLRRHSARYNTSTSVAFICDSLRCCLLLLLLLLLFDDRDNQIVRSGIRAIFGPNNAKIPVLLLLSSSSWCLPAGYRRSRDFFVVDSKFTNRITSLEIIETIETASASANMFNASSHPSRRLIAIHHVCQCNGYFVSIG